MFISTILRVIRTKHYLVSVFLLFILVLNISAVTITGDRYRLRKENFGTFIYQKNSTNSFVGAQDRGNNYVREVLCNFDVSSLTGLTVTSVTLQFNYASDSGAWSSIDVTCYDENKGSWTDDGSTTPVYTTFPNTAWNNSLGSVTVNRSSTGWYSIGHSTALSNEVQGWLDNSADNNGVVLSADVYYLYYMYVNAVRLIVHTLPPPKMWYVHAQSGNDNNDGSSSSPLRTIQAAIASNTGGGNIYCAGNFTLTAPILFTNTTGSKRNPIQLTAWPNGSKPYITNVNAGNTVLSVNADNASYIKISRLILCGGYRGIAVGSIGARVGLTNISIFSNEIRNTSAAGIYVKSGVTNIMIHDNSIHGVSGSGIHIDNGGSGNQTSDATLKNNIIYSNNGNGIYADYANGVLTIQSNICHYNGNGNGENGIYINNFQGSVMNPIMGNICMHNYEAGILLENSGGNRVIRNNTCINNGRRQAAETDNSGIVLYNTGSGNSVRNNICMSNFRYGISYYGNTDGISSYNCFIDNGTRYIFGGTLGVSNLHTNPKLINTIFLDTDMCRLQNGSPCIDAGYPGDAPYKNAIIDIGADETAFSPPPPPPPINWTGHIVNLNHEGTAISSSVDIDGDGDIDIVATAQLNLHSTSQGQISWFENNNGNGTSWTKHDITDEWFSTAYGVHTADIDNDGDLDVVGTAGWGDIISWFENDNGSGTSWTKHDIITDFEMPTSVHCADFDGDGDMDVLGGSARTNGDDITWWENTDGTGLNWEEHIIDDDLFGVYVVYAADIDGDGDLDAISGVLNDNKVIWFENDTGNGITWTKHIVRTNFNDTKGVYCADMDGDNDLDIIAVAQGAGDVYWFENDTGDGENWTEHLIDNNVSYSRPRTVCSADMDGDGHMDVLCSFKGYDKKASQFAFYKNTGSGWLWDHHVINNTYYGGHSIEAADINGDGTPDVIGLAVFDSDVLWWEMDNVPGVGLAWSINNGYDGYRGCRFNKIISNNAFFEVRFINGYAGSPPNTAEVWIDLNGNVIHDGASEVFTMNYVSGSYSTGALYRFNGTVIPTIGGLARYRFNFDYNGHAATGKPSEWNYCFIIVGPPTDPSWVNITNVSAYGFTVNWHDSRYENKYRYVLSNAATGAIVSNILTPHNLTNKTISGLTTNTTYIMKLYATNATGVSATIITNVTTLRPPPTDPSWTTVTGLAASTFTINWNDSSYENNYRYVVSNTATGVRIVDTLLAADTVSQTHSGLTTNTTYVITLYATNNISASATITTNVTTILPLPTNPSWGSITGAHATGFTINWNDSLYEYNYRYILSNAANGTIISNLLLNADTVLSAQSGLDTNTIYYMKLYATNNAGVSATIITNFDTTGPVITAMQPNGITVSGISVSVSANISDDISVVTAQYRIDGGSWLSLTRTGGTAQNGTWTAIWNSTVVNDATHTLYIRAWDNSGLCNTNNASFTTHNNNPPVVVSIIQPAPGTYTGNVTIQAYITDDTSVLSAQYRVDGGTWHSLSGTSSAGGIWNGTLDSTAYPDGTHTIYVRGVDAEPLAHTNSVSNIIFDNTGPLITNIAPNMSSGNQTGTINISANITDTSGISAGSAQYRIDNGGWQLLSGSSPNYSASGVKITSLSGGTHTLYIRARDTRTLWSTNNTTFVVNGPPSITSVIPAPNSTISATVNIDATITDDIGIATVYISVDGGSEQTMTRISGSTTSGTWRWSCNTTGYVDGSHTFRIRAIDGGPLEDSTNYTLIVNNGGISINITSPSAGYVIGTTSISADITHASGITTAEYRISGGSWSSLPNTAGNTYATSWNTVTHADGAATVYVRARNTLGIWATNNVAVTIDNTPPVIVITSPTNTAIISGSVSIDASASSDATSGLSGVLQYRIDGGVWIGLSGGGTGIWNTTAVSDGSHTIYVRGSDTVGLSATNSIGITVQNNTAPNVVSIIRPTSGTYTGTVLVQAYITDDTAVTAALYRIDSGSWTALTNSSGSGTAHNAIWSAMLDSINYSDGTHTIYVRAVDATGLADTNSVSSIVFDNTPPVITAIQPNTNSGSQSGTINISANINDATSGISTGSAQYRIDGGTWQLLDGNEPNYSFSGRNISSLTNGRHMLYIRAHDTQNLWATNNAAFIVFTNAPPVIVIRAPQASATVYGTNALISAYVTDDLPPIDSVAWQLDGTAGAWTPMALSNSAGIYTTIWDITLAVQGNHTVYVRARDHHGKYTTNHVTISVAGAPPPWIITPQNNAIVSKNLTITGIVSPAVHVSNLIACISNTITGTRTTYDMTNVGSTNYSVTFDTHPYTDDWYVIRLVLYPSNRSSVYDGNGGVRVYFLNHQNVYNVYASDGIHEDHVLDGSGTLQAKVGNNNITILFSTLQAPAHVDSVFVYYEIEGTGNVIAAQAVPIENTGNRQWVMTIYNVNGIIAPGKRISFYITVDGFEYPLTRINNPNIRWVTKIEEIKDQEEEVTIVNNNIDINNGGLTYIIFTLNTPDLVSVKVYNIRGEEIATVLAETKFRAGRFVQEWNGYDENNEPCAPGMYLLVVERASREKPAVRMAIVK